MSRNLNVAKSYYKLLVAIDWRDDLMIMGLKEGLNKFLSNAFLSLDKGNKYKKGDFYSISAVKLINSGQFSNLVYEHMVPKSKYIQKKCEHEAKKGCLTVEYIVDLLNRYWKIAVITKDENQHLLVSSMPSDWDQENIFRRYNDIGLALVQSPFLSNEDKWRTVLSSLAESDDTPIWKNTNGQDGSVLFEGGRIIVKTVLKSYDYSFDADFDSIRADGWYFS